MTGLPVPVGTLNLIRAVLGIHHHRFDLFVKCSSGLRLSDEQVVEVKRRVADPNPTFLTLEQVGKRFAQRRA
jgi:hypothetical protein